jgi:hypothetical protein
MNDDSRESARHASGLVSLQRPRQLRRRAPVGRSLELSDLYVVGDANPSWQTAVFVSTDADTAGHIQRPS